MKGGGGTHLKKFKTRRSLIALLATLCVLGAGGIAGALAAKSRADVKKDGTRISKIREIEEGAFDASSSSSSSSASSSSTLEASMPGIVSVSPAPDVQGVNTTASIASYGPNALTFTFNAPSGLTILPFLFNTSTSAYWNGSTNNNPFYPANSTGQGFNATQVEEAIESGNYVSSISVSTPTGTYEQPVPLLGGVQPETGKVVSVTNAYPDGMQLPNSFLNTKGISIEQYFQKECNADATFSVGAYEGKTLSDVLGVSEKDLTPEACDAIFHKNVDLTVTFGAKSYSLTSPQQVEELISSLDINIPSTNFVGYNGPGIDGPMQIHATLSGMAVYFLGIYFDDTQQNTVFAPTINLWPSTKTGDLYSAKGAQIQVSSTVEGKPANSYTYTYQLFGNAPDNYYSSSAPASDFTSDGLLSPSSPAGPLGLYFNAVSQTGQPLTQVQVALQFEGALGNGLNAERGSYIWPAYWNPSNVNDYNVGENYPYSGPSSLNLTSPTPYEYYGWGNSANADPTGHPNASIYSGQAFAVNSIPGHPGCFALSGLPAGTYNVTVFGSLQQEGYYVSTFTATLGSYSAPETFTSYIDPDGFIDVSKDTVVTNPVLPNTYFLYSDGKAAYSASTGNTPSLSQTVGSANVFDYQLSTYLSYGPMQFFFPTYQGYQLNFPDATIAGIPFSVLKEHGASLTGPSDAYNGIDLSAEAISYIEENGYLPATPTQPGHTSKIILATGLSNRTLSVTIPTYLTSQFTAGNQVGVNINYSGTSKLGGQSITQGYYPSATTNGAADDSVPSSLTPGSTPSSSSGLWFKDLQADGQPSSGAKFVVQDSSGRYLVKEINSYGRFSGWGWTAAAASATEFSQENDSALFSMGGLKNGTYTVTQIQWPDSMTGSSGLADGNNWPSPDLSGGSKTAAPPSFEVTLSYSSPEAMSTQADPAGTVDAKDDWIYSLSPIEMAPMDGSSLSSLSYQTETVGIPFTEGWEGYLPIASVSPDKASPAGLDSALKITLPEVSSSTPCGAADSIQASQIDIAGISMETLEKNTKATFSSRSSLASIYLPYSALEYLEENGKNVESDNLSSSSDRRIIVTFPAEITEGFKDGSVLHQGMGLGSNWWMQDAPHFTSSSPLYTNGPADNSLPSSLSMSSTSGSTGLWFKSLWWGRNTPAQGAKFTVSQTRGGKTVYLTPVESGGTFTGWSWEPSPYDFTEQNSDADFSMGGLQDGTYTVTEVDPAAGATPSSLTFTSSLSYSSPEALSDVTDSLHLLSASQGVVYNMVVPSSLPLTGGSWVLIVSSAAVLLFAAGAVMLKRRKKA